MWKRTSKPNCFRHTTSQASINRVMATHRHSSGRGTIPLTSLLLLVAASSLPPSLCFLPTTTLFQASRISSSPSSPLSTIPTTTTTLQLQKQQQQNNNEWGIPNSQDLPPLQTVVTPALPNGGRVTLIGSGPGDPDLLTVAAYRLLTTADPSTTLVVADRLVAPEILALIACPTRVARKLPGCAALAQEEIYWWMYQALQEGKHVIRLKIGDPFVFGRGGEEVLTCRQVMGVEPTVSPGVSAAFSAPLLAQIPVTHRGVANQVVICTGYGREGTSPDLIQYHKEQTIVFLMAVGRLPELCRRLVESAGYPPSTPVAIVEQAGCPDQRTVVGDMTTIADVAEKHQIKPPSTIVVGGVVNVLLRSGDEEGDAVVSGLIQNATSTIAC